MEERIITLETTIPIELELRVVENDEGELVPVQLLSHSMEDAGINDLVFDEEDQEAIVDAWLADMLEDELEDDDSESDAEVFFLFDEDEDIDEEELILDLFRADDGEFYFDAEGNPIPVEELEGYEIVDPEEL